VFNREIVAKEIWERRLTATDLTDLKLAAVRSKEPTDLVNSPAVKLILSRQQSDLADKE
jgi:hypothetical protein